MAFVFMFFDEIEAKRDSHGKDLAPPGLMIIRCSFPELHGPKLQDQTGITVLLLKLQNRLV